MAKRELIWAPLLGQYREFRSHMCLFSVLSALLMLSSSLISPVAASGAVFVDRKNRQNALAAMTEAGEDMKRRGVSLSSLRRRRVRVIAADHRQISLWVFPEGTRSSSAEPKLLPFKKGAFHLAVQAQIPVIPVVCENYHRLFDGKTRFERGDLRIRGEYARLRCAREVAFSSSR